MMATLFFLHFFHSIFFCCAEEGVSWSIIEFPSVYLSYFHAQVIATLPRCHIALIVSPFTYIPHVGFSSSPSYNFFLNKTKHCAELQGNICLIQNGAQIKCCHLSWFFSSRLCGLFTLQFLQFEWGFSSFRHFSCDALVTHSQGKLIDWCRLEATPNLGTAILALFGSRFSVSFELVSQFERHFGIFLNFPYHALVKKCQKS